MASVITKTFYPDAHPESTSVDGRVIHQVATTGILWADLVAAVGSGANDGSAYLAIIHMECGSDTDRYAALGRGILLFDTSAIPTGAVIISAILSLYGSGKADNGDPTGWLPDINIYAASPALDTQLVAGDFDSLGSTPFCDTPIGYNDWNIAGYNDFALNAAGKAAILKTGITKLGVRNANYDVAGVAPTWQYIYGGNLDSYWFNCYCAEQGNGYKPKLTITYYPESFGLDQTIVGDKVALEAVRNLEFVYGGRFYISKSGNAVYESRYHRNV